MSIPRPSAPNTPRRVRVRASQGTPIVVDGKQVEELRENWLVEDKWWTDEPICRRYWEVLTTTGKHVVVFHDVVEDAWYTQAA
jgi:hypothetical protein